MAPKKGKSFAGDNEAVIHAIAPLFDDDDGGNDDDNHVDDDDEEEEADSDDEMIKRRIAGVQSNRQLQRIKWQILSLPPSLSLHLSLCTPRPCKSIAMG